VTLDLVVLGGGITGLAVARLAARSGWSVTLVERDDLACGASSTSSHMLHGGLRYLEHGHFGLVREALAERATVARMAPALSRPVRFMVPLVREGRLHPWKLRTGLWLYDVFAGRESLSARGWASARDALALEPDLAPAGLLGAGLYSDGVMDDARLAVAVARDAAVHGATILTRAEVSVARPAADSSGDVVLAVRDRETNAEQELRCGVVVNATGAWCDATRRELARSLRPGTPDPHPLLRPSRGTHLVYPALTRGHGVLVTAASDGRAFFVVPFAGRSLVGTTEHETASPPPPEDCVPSPDEIRYLASEVARVLPAAAAQRPLAVFAGVRPLLDSGGSVGSASREHRVVTEAPLVTIAGGKYTTFRVMARDTLAAAARLLRRDPASLAPDAVPLPAPLAEAAGATTLGSHAAEHEFARSLEDVLRRRSTHWLDDDGGLAAAPEVASGIGRRLGWSPEREREEIDRWESAVRANRERLEQALAIRT
jgi:glycerol-3-phosphate dehydrogenase